jgi:hypothetical protein
MSLNKLARAARTRLSGRTSRVQAQPDPAAEFLARLRPPAGPPANDPPAPNPLWDYFQANRTGPGIWKWVHYFEIYQRHLAKFVGRRPHVVEIGVYSGGSLGMWRHYFGAGCHVSGVDIEEACVAYANDNTSIHIGDQADRRFWERFRHESPPIDVVIDDGGHSPQQQRITLEETLPHLRPGGVYLCEDVCGDANEFAAYVHRLAASLHAAHWTAQNESGNGSAARATPLQQLVHSIHVYPFVVVIERTEGPRDSLEAPKHGTEWQPFL